MVANICNPSAWVTKAGGFSVQDQLLGKPYSKEIREMNKILAKYHWWNKIGFVSVETTTECQEKEKHLISLDFKIPQSNKVA